MRAQRVACSLGEEDAGGAVYVVGRGGGGEDAGLSVASKDGYVVRELTGYDQVLAVGGERVVAGFFAAEWGVGDEDEVAVGSDLISDEIFGGTTVAGVEEAAGGIDEDFAGTVVSYLVSGRQGGNAG